MSTVPQAQWAASTPGEPGGERVELAAFPDGTIAIRSSWSPDGLWLVFGREAVRAFLDAAKAGEFDHLVQDTQRP